MLFVGLNVTLTSASVTMLLKSLLTGCFIGISPEHVSSTNQTRTRWRRISVNEDQSKQRTSYWNGQARNMTGVLWKPIWRLVGVSEKPETRSYASDMLPDLLRFESSNLGSLRNR